VAATTVQPVAPAITATLVDRLDVAASVAPAVPDIVVAAQVNAADRIIAATVQTFPPLVVASLFVGRKTIRGTATNNQQLYDEDNAAHNTILFDWRWYDGVGISIFDSAPFSTGQVTTDAAGNWSIEIAASALVGGQEGTFMVQGNVDPLDKQWLQMPVEIV